MQEQVLQTLEQALRTNLLPLVPEHQMSWNQILKKALRRHSVLVSAQTSHHQTPYLAQERYSQTSHRLQEHRKHSAREPQRRTELQIPMAPEHQTYWVPVPALQSLRNWAQEAHWADQKHLPMADQRHLLRVVTEHQRDWAPERDYQRREPYW